jgi:HEPN domain-containing protein
MRTKEELIKSWLKKAEKDLLTAKHELSFADAVTESICFHCQQAAEKYLKAYLVYLGIPFIKTHDKQREARGYSNAGMIKWWRY